MAHEHHILGAPYLPSLDADDERHFLVMHRDIEVHGAEHAAGANCWCRPVIAPLDEHLTVTQIRDIFDRATKLN